MAFLRSRLAVYLVFAVGVGLFLYSAAVLEVKGGYSPTIPPVTTITASPKFVNDEKFNYSSFPDVTVVMWDGDTPFSWGHGDEIPEPNYGGYKIVKKKCPVKCSFITDRRALPRADAVLFDVCKTGPTEWRDVPVYLPEKRPWQTWWWFAYEQPEYFPLMKQKDYMKRFDHKMVYDHDSDVQITFMCPWGGIEEVMSPPPKKSKDKVVALMASNCDTGGAARRTEYVRELMKYIQVDSYGYCLHNKDFPDKDNMRRKSHGEQMRQKIRVIGEYKFFLAFENNDVTPDYVTEKIMNAFQAGAVPVYWGAPNIDMWLPDENSAIKTRDFPSPEALAHYLNYLNEHEDEYMKFFEWKKKPTPHFLELLDNCLFYAECRMCKAVAQLRARKIADGVDIDHALAKWESQDPFMGGYALQLNCIDCEPDLSDDFVEVADHNSLQFENELTITAWIKLNHIQDGRIVDKNEAGTLSGIEFDVLRKDNSGGKGQLRFCGGGLCITSERLLGLGVWYHVAITFRYYGSEDDLVALYINGKKDNTVTPTMPLVANSLPLRFGRASVGGGAWRGYHPSSVFDGVLDEISLWSKAVTQETIDNLQFTRLFGNEPGLVGYYPFNEGKGEQTKDLSIYKNHGRLVGNPIWVPTMGKPLNDLSNLEV